MNQVYVVSENCFTLSKFQKKKCDCGELTHYFYGFKLNERNERAKSFFEPYFGKDEELYPFQIKRSNNYQKEEIKQQNSPTFIVVQFIQDGKFLSEVEKISKQTIKAIFLQLLKAIFQLHQKGILARCLSSQNIFFDQYQNKIYLFEFGFNPYVNFNAIYKPNYDELFKKKINNIQDKQGDEFEQFEKKILDLEAELQNLEDIESYYKLYQLDKDGPSQQEIKKLYTDTWVKDMKQKIKTLDFPSVIRIQYPDPDQTEDDKKIPKTSYQFLQLTIKIFQKKYPTHYDQIGLMLAFQSSILDQVSHLNENERITNHKKREKIKQKRMELFEKHKSQITEEFKYLLKPENNKIFNKSDQESISNIYKLKVKQTYQTLFEEKVQKYKLKYIVDFTLEEANILFMLMASLKMFDFEGVYKIYNTKEVCCKIKKASEIYRKFDFSKLSTQNNT